MATGHDIIRRAMIRAGILPAHETPTAQEANDALSVLNELIEQFSLTDDLSFYSVLESFQLTSGDSEYTFGSGGDFNSTAPIKIINANVVVGASRIPLSLITEKEYNSLTNISSSGVPAYISVNYSYPLAALKFYPKPSSNYTVNLLSAKKIETAALYDNLDIPDGWTRALVLNLAVELCGEYGVQADQTLVVAARDAISALKNSNLRRRFLRAFNASQSSGDIYSGFSR